jgi:predicted XRE-type DNA-binding protein
MSSTDHTSSMERIKDASANLIAARQELLDSISDALKSGVQQRDVATAVGVHRISIYRWIKQQEAQSIFHDRHQRLIERAGR